MQLGARVAALTAGLVPLAGQKQAEGAGDHPEQAAPGLALRAASKQARSGAASAWQSLASWPGSLLGVPQPSSAEFSRCLTLTEHGSQAWLHLPLPGSTPGCRLACSLLVHPPGDARTPVLALQSAFLQV